jgi:hypothetical protein
MGVLYNLSRSLNRGTQSIQFTLNNKKQNTMEKVFKTRKELMAHIRLLSTESRVLMMRDSSKFSKFEPIIRLAVVDHTRQLDDYPAMGVNTENEHVGATERVDDNKAWILSGTKIMQHFASCKIQLHDGTQVSLVSNASKVSQYNDEFYNTDSLVELFNGGYAPKDSVVETIDGKIFAKDSSDIVLSAYHQGYISKRDSMRIVIGLDDDGEFIFSDVHKHRESYVNARYNGDWINVLDSRDVLEALDIIHVTDDRHCGDCYIRDAEYSPRLNAGYQSLNRKDLSHSDTKFRIGFEIEKEDYSAYEIPYSALFDETHWAKENDGSLCDESGYELVTPIYDLMTDDMDNDIDNSDSLQQLINAEYSSSCGGHINISAEGYSSKQLFEGISGFLPLFYSLYAHRLEQDYCKGKEKHKYYDDKKYSAVYIKRHVVELRIVSAVVNVKNLIWRRDLIRIVMQNINASEKEVLQMMCDPKSLLHMHLRKVYSSVDLIRKINQFIEHCNVLNNKKLEPLDVSGIKDEDVNNSDESLSNAEIVEGTQEP